MDSDHKALTILGAILLSVFALGIVVCRLDNYLTSKLAIETGLVQKVVIINKSLGATEHEVIWTKPEQDQQHLELPGKE